MILDTGICTLFREGDIAEAGHMPRKGWLPLGRSWYGELAFGSAPVFETEHREEAQQDQRIRIHQMRGIRPNRDAVVLADVERLPAMGVTIYRITRAFHGVDPENGAPITDLSLQEVSP